MNKRSALLNAAIAAAVFTMAGTASAGGTHTIAVSASVTGVCLVNTANSTLAFGPLDPSVGGTVSALWSGGTFRCTNGTTYTITSNDGLWETGPGGTNNRMKNTAGAVTDCSTATNCIRYTLTSVTTGSGLGMSGNDISFGVTGQTTTADYVNAAAGSYADTVILTVSP